MNAYVQFDHSGQAVSAMVVATLTMNGRSRVILIDTSDRHWVIEDTTLKVVAGPITGAQALHAAESLLAGVQDHGSVAKLVNELALGVVALAHELEARAA